MAHEIKVPPMGESVSSGVLANWRVKDGEMVAAGQSLYDLETDKITQEGTADRAGVIRLKIAVGTEVKVGDVVALIEEPGSVPPTASSSPKVPTPAQASEQLSPAVRKLAMDTGIDPATVAGTGKGGRVTKGDMLQAVDKAAAETAPADLPPAPPLPESPLPMEKPIARAALSPAPSLPAAAAPVVTPLASAPETAANSSVARTSRVKMSPLRRKIAERLVQAQHTAAILTTFNEVDLQNVMDLRKKYQEAFTARHGVKLGFMSFFVKAVVAALQDVPALNAQIEGDEIVQNHFHDIGVAVSTPRGLLVPVVRQCDRLSLAEIEKAIAAYGQKAKEGKIAIDDLQGGVFTISNGGIFGSMLSTPILNPPQSGILGLHAIKERPVAINGQVVIRPMMYLALSYDHRLVDGREAVTFLVKMKEVIEDPARLLLGV